MGGGGGSNKELKAQMAQEEAERQRKQALRDHVNALYGIGDGTPTPAAALTDADRLNMENAVRKEMGLPGVSVLSSDAPVIRNRDSDNPVKRRPRAELPAGLLESVEERAGKEMKRRQEVAALTATKSVKNRMKARETSYDRLGTNVQAFHMDPFREEQEKAARLLKFRLADTGQIGGSLQVDKQSELRRAGEKGLREISDMSTAAENSARQGDEQSRLDLLTRIDSGMDDSSAVSAALSQLATNSQRQLDAAKGQSMSDVFGNIGYLYNQHEVGQGRKAARDRFGTIFNGGAPTPGSSGGGYGGTVTRG